MLLIRHELTYVFIKLSFRMTSVGSGVTSVCVASQTDSYWQDILASDILDSALPRDFRNRLHKMFERVERDFEREYQKICAENFARMALMLL